MFILFYITYFFINVFYFNLIKFYEFLLSMLSATMHSVVSIVDATLTAVESAVRVTLNGSIIPSFIMSPYVSFFAS